MKHIIDLLCSLSLILECALLALLVVSACLALVRVISSGVIPALQPAQP
jgi:hypothetical protein